jgi:hypothetical protein
MKKYLVIALLGCLVSNVCAAQVQEIERHNKKENKSEKKALKVEKKDFKGERRAAIKKKG